MSRWQTCVCYLNQGMTQCSPWATVACEDRFRGTLPGPIGQLYAATVSSGLQESSG